MNPEAEIKPAPLDYLRIVADASRIFASEPESAGARRRRDDMVIIALRHEPPREVAEAAGISAEKLFEILADSLPEPRRSRRRSKPERRREDGQAFAGSITSVRRMLFPEGSRNPESTP